MKYLTLFLEAVTKVFGYLGQRTGLANSPEMQKSAKAQQEQREIDKGNREIGGAIQGDKKSLQDLRNDVSE